MTKFRFKTLLIITSVFSSFAFAKTAAKTTKAPVSNSSSSASSSSSSSSSSAKPVATGKESAEPAAKPDAPKAVNFTAQDVWSKDLFEQDDNKVLVIQDRKYNKTKRLELGLDMGVTSATAFYNSYTVGLRSAYYLSEYWGVQGFVNKSFNTPSREKDQLDEYLLKSNFKSSKEFKAPEIFAGVGVLWNPIYGKFAWFRSRIIHFDIYGGLGVSYLKTSSTFNATQAPGDTRREGKDDSSFGTLANLGMRIFISKNLAWSTEVRNNIYQASYQATITGGGTPVAPRKVWQNNFQFTTGVSYLFNLGGY